jgi:hypothetical protein
MKIAIIDIGWRKINSHNPTSEALGGSETWIVQIANEFSKHSEIKDYYLCSPLEITEDKIVIPVQFVFSDGRLNTVFYLQKEDNLLKIEKIEFGEFSSDK